MSTSNGNNKPTTNDELIKDTLKKYPKLDHLKAVLLRNIETLNDELLKEQGLEATLDLLLKHSRIELLTEKINTTKPTDAPLPRSIRIKIELTSSLEETREAPEFKQLQSEADNVKLQYQQKMRGLIIKTMTLDNEMLKKQFRESFFKHAANLIETKIFYELQMASEDTTTSKIFQETGGAKTASAYTCMKIFEQRQGIINNDLELSFDRMKHYLDTTTEDIKKGIIAQFNKEEAEKIIANQTPLGPETIQKFQNDINRIISYCSTLMTAETLTHHKNEIKKRNAIATTAATFNNKKVEETTAEVATALAKEGSMSTKTMEQYIDKRIKENLAKNSERGKNKNNLVNATKNTKTKKFTDKRKPKEITDREERRGRHNQPQRPSNRSTNKSKVNPKTNNNDAPRQYQGKRQGTRQGQKPRHQQGKQRRVNKSQHSSKKQNTYRHNKRYNAPNNKR